MTPCLTPLLTAGRHLSDLLIWQITLCWTGAQKHAKDLEYIFIVSELHLRLVHIDEIQVGKRFTVINICDWRVNGDHQGASSR